MKKSYAYLRIICNDKRERALIKERLAEVTPFYRKRKELRYCLINILGIQIAHTPQ